MLSYREHLSTVYHALVWLKNDGSTCAFSFDCDEQGNVDESKLCEPARENLRKCRAGEFPDYEPQGIEQRESFYTVPAVGQCDCGARVTLDSFTNTCRCGADYNMSGQLLAPREQWGEETGEHLSEILNIPNY